MLPWRRLGAAVVLSALGLVVLLTGALPLTAATPKKVSEVPSKDASVAAKVVEDDGDFPPVADQPAVIKHFSQVEIQRYCKQYEGHMVAFYDDIYKVEHCSLRKILDNKTVYNMQRAGHTVQDVSSDVIAALHEGEALDEATTAKYARSCKQLDKHYVTFSSVDVYYVEHCTKRLFPDWTTYIKHRERHSDKNGEILSLSFWEFDRLRSGTPIPSIVDDLFARLLTGSAEVEVIPVDEACVGIDGKVVAFYSHVYKVERCHKRDIDEPDRYLKRLGIDKVKVVEMSAEQWLSLPDGAKIIVEAIQSGAKAIELHPSIPGR
jgi:hypothetical protein